MSTLIPTRPRRRSTGPGTRLLRPGRPGGVTASLEPGESLTLTIGGPYYAGGSSSFPAGMQVYAYADSINYATSYGNVKESNEGNNVFGPVVSTAASAAVSAVEAEATPEGLPGR